ncbi:MAG: SigB/SigF/SigG family RNA polymerase sigma factor [Chloroflexi bacterium]|nr:SigB/SigF/SigG family RNA polymerase sigma factor [Chloroflexota bacterium]
MRPKVAPITDTKKRPLHGRQLLDKCRTSEDMSAAECLEKHCLPLVRRVCKRFVYRGEPLEDLVQIGSIGLLKAMKRYDPDKGRFVAFAVPIIIGEVKNYFRDHGWAVKFPRKLQRHKIAVERAVERLSQELGRGPTVPEIAQTTKLTEDEIYDTFELEKYSRPLSLEAEYDENGSKDGSSLLDQLGSEDPLLEKLTDSIDITNLLRCLSKKERTIIYLKFYGDLSQTQIAERLGVSQMHISRLQRKAIDKLKLSLVRS